MASRWVLPSCSFRATRAWDVASIRKRVRATKAGAGNDVNSPVQTPVAASIDPDMLAGPALPGHGRGSAVAGEVVLGPEAPDVPDLGQQQTGDDGAHTREIHGATACTSWSICLSRAFTSAAKASTIRSRLARTAGVCSAPRRMRSACSCWAKCWRVRVSSCTGRSHAGGLTAARVGSACSTRATSTASCGSVLRRSRHSTTR